MVAPNSSSPISRLGRCAIACGSVTALALAVASLRSATASVLSRNLREPSLHLFTTCSVHHTFTPHHPVTCTGWWHTEGSRIVSDRHTTVRIAGVNWSGLETTNAVPGGLDRKDYHAVLQMVAEQGFNTIRIPFSNQIIEQPIVPSAIGFENEAGPINADLEGLTSLQILDHIVSAAGQLGLKVILDDHRSEAGSSAEANGLWYTEAYPEQAWIADWITLAERYRREPAVVGFDLRNEPHNAASGGACWDCGGSRDWHLAAARAGNAVLRVNPNLLVFIEGTDSVDGSVTWWGGNLSGVRRSPVHLSVPNHLVYSTHVYGPSEYPQPWFNANTTPASLAANWRHNWAYLAESNVAPVWVGEFGTPTDAAAIDAASPEPGSDRQWFHSLVSFLYQHPEIGWTYWGLNGEDRYGLLDTTYTSANLKKSSELATIVPRAIDSYREPYAQPAPHGATSPADQAQAEPVHSTPYTPPALTPGTQQPQPAPARQARHLNSAPSTHEAAAEQVRLATRQALRNLQPTE